MLTRDKLLYTPKRAAIGAVNSAWDTSQDPLNDGATAFSNGGRTVTMIYGGQDQTQYITLANKLPPAKCYLEILIDAAIAAGVGSVIERIGVSAFATSNFHANPPGQNDYTWGLRDTGDYKYNFNTGPTAGPDSHMTWATGSRLSVAIDNSVTPPTIEISNDGVTYGSCIDPGETNSLPGHNTLKYVSDNAQTPRASFVAGLFMNGSQYTICTGSDIVRTPKAGFTVVP